MQPRGGDGRAARGGGGQPARAHLDREEACGGRGGCAQRSPDEGDAVEEQQCERWGGADGGASTPAISNGRPGLGDFGRKPSPFRADSGDALEHHRNPARGIVVASLPSMVESLGENHTLVSKVADGGTISIETLLNASFGGLSSQTPV
uniref:Uncharacterized protein n=2 Tax=Oryza sativa subsp. japonica TaxID=39947 RepID=Q10K50_ORYSJ|nr:Unknown protein [Oryza sativa Japonica Group]ABF96425.1 hypothetical protein LOC_Os03g27890 [Oryza sativa Japonica Group]